jgi:hypothetical protein
MGVEVHDEIGDAAVIGYWLRGAPGGSSRDLIEAINARDATVVSLDVPSGLDASTGEKPGMVVEADATQPASEISSLPTSRCPGRSPQDLGRLHQTSR